MAINDWRAPAEVGREEIALIRIALRRDDLTVLVVGFDSFGHDAHLQAVRKSDDCAHDEPTRGLPAEIGDEDLADLDSIDRKLLEIAQRGETGSEVVERELRPESPEVVQHDQGTLTVLDEDISVISSVTCRGSVWVSLRMSATMATKSGAIS